MPRPLTVQHRASCRFNDPADESRAVSLVEAVVPLGVDRMDVRLVKPTQQPGELDAHDGSYTVIWLEAPRA